MRFIVVHVRNGAADFEDTSLDVNADNIETFWNYTDDSTLIRMVGNTTPLIVKESREELRAMLEEL